jgi:hypothetical protein
MIVTDEEGNLDYTKLIDLTINSITTRFVLLSKLTIDDDIIQNEEDGVKSLMYVFENVALPLIRTGVTFKNLRIQGKIIVFICIDDYTYQPLDEASFLRPYKLEARTLNFWRWDIKVLGTIMTTEYPLSLAVQYVTIIDYQNTNSGFDLETRCNYDGAVTTGAILFEYIDFETETDAIEFKLKPGSLLHSTAPVNYTIRNSEFNLNHRSMENYNVFNLEDSGDCTPNDDEIHQEVNFINNTFTYDTFEDGLFNNIYIYYSGSNERFREILINNNTFQNMNGAVKSFVYIDITNDGNIAITDNTITNSSSSEYFFYVSDRSSITFDNNKFDSLIMTSSGILEVENAQTVTLSNTEVVNNTHIINTWDDPVFKISTEELGEVTIEYSTFHENYFRWDVIYLYEPVGSFIFQNNNMFNEMLMSFTNYITAEDLYKMDFSDSVMYNLEHDSSNKEITLVLLLKSIRLDVEGNITMTSVECDGCWFQFLMIESVSGISVAKNNVILQNITIKNASFTSGNPLLTFGPIYTKQDVEFTIKESLFDNLIFTNAVSLIHVYLQGPNDFILESCIFQNIIGGHIKLDPLTTVDGSFPTNIYANNLTVYYWDFMDKTLFVLEENCEIDVYGCTMNRNSGYFRGTIVSIVGKNSRATFTNCNFNNNNGINGGVFYVEDQSVINVINSVIYNNFAVKASIAYVGRQGSMIITGWTITKNNAYTITLIELVDTTESSIFSNTIIDDNSVISKEEVIDDIDDQTIWFQLWFASAGYFAYLSKHRSLLDDIVSANLS